MSWNLKPTLTGFPASGPRGIVEEGHATRSFQLGQLINDNYGNFYRYVKANEAITAGDALTAVAEGVWDSGIVMDGAVTSGNKIHVDTITTAKAAGFYKDYMIHQAVAASKGYSYRITGHDAFAASGEADVYVTPDVAETLADGAALRIYAPWLMELVDATTEIIMGVAVHDIASGSFGFMQVGGTVPAVKVGHSTSAAVVINEPLHPVGSGNAGAVQGFAATTPNEAEILTGKGNLFALQASNANTTGFAPCYIKGIL